MYAPDMKGCWSVKHEKADGDYVEKIRSDNLCSAKSLSSVDCAFWTCNGRLLLADLVVSENTNGAESSNPGGILEIGGDQPTRH